MFRREIGNLRFRAPSLAPAILRGRELAAKTDLDRQSPGRATAKSFISRPFFEFGCSSLNKEPQLSYPPGTFLVQGAMLCPLPSAKKNPRPPPFGFPGYIPRCEGFVPTDPA